MGELSEDDVIREAEEIIRRAKERAKHKKPTKREETWKKAEWELTKLRKAQRKVGEATSATRWAIKKFDNFEYSEAIGEIKETVRKLNSAYFGINQAW